MKFIKILFLSMMVWLTGVSASAQVVTENYAGSSKFFDNWSVGVEGGIQTNLNDWNSPLGGVAGVNLNKQLTPVFGLSLEGYAGFNNTGNWYSPTAHFHNGNVVDNVNVYLTGRWNITNSILGYTGSPRLFEVETNVGVGYGRYFNSSYIADDANVILGKAGLNFNFNLGAEKAWTITVKPAVIWDFTNAHEFSELPMTANAAVFQVTAGFVYHFKTSNGGRHIAASSVPVLLGEVDALNAQVNDLRAALANAEARASVVPEKVVETVAQKEVEYVESTYLVTFAQNRSVLTEASKMVLDMIPEGTTVDIVAYASPEGTKTYNQKLSVVRSEVVRDYLTNRGVNVNKVTGSGVVDETSNRIAVVTVVR